MDSLVSVIIPCYNAENTIKNSIQSVLKQTYQNMEIIVVNDGSTDGSEDIVQDMVLKHKNIVSISTENKGVGSARNRGIIEAKGKYIAFLDADDVYADNFIEVLVRGIEQYRCDTAYCKWTRNNFEGNIVYHEEEQYIFLKKQMLKRKYKVSFCNYLYRHSILIQKNILFPTDLKYGEDGAFVMEYLAHCKRAVSVDASLYKYCDNENSAVHHVVWRRAVDNIEAGKRNERILANTPIYQEYCEFAVPRSIWASAKNFASAKEYELFLRLDQEYDIKKCMKQLINNRNTENTVRMFAVVYCLNTGLFYKLISWMGNYQ